MSQSLHSLLIELLVVLYLKLCLLAKFFLSRRQEQRKIAILGNNFVLVMCCFFVEQEEITSGSRGELMSLFYRKRECLQGSCDQLLVSRSLMWKCYLSLKKQTSLCSLGFPFRLSHFKTLYQLLWWSHQNLCFLSVGSNVHKLNKHFPLACLNFFVVISLDFHPGRL